MHIIAERTIEIALTDNEKDVLTRFFNLLSYHVTRGEMYEITAKDLQILFNENKIELSSMVIKI